MTGYVRSFDKTDGVDPIRSGDFESEFTAIETAFNQSAGHKHDGTTSEGPYISILGDTTAKDKVVIDGTNHEIEFWNNVSGTAVQQVIVKDGAIEPTTTNDIDLGSSTKYFKNIYGNVPNIANVKTYGATGNGTADDTTYIQAAIDAVYAAGGGVVYFPSGTYKITAPLVIDDEVVLRGDGVASVIYATTDIEMVNTAGVSGTNYLDMSIQGLYFKRRIVGARPTKYHIHLINASRFLLRDCLIDETSAAVTDVTDYDIGGIYFAENGSNSYINWVDRNVIYGHIRMDCSDSKITNNFIYGLGSNCCIYINGSAISVIGNDISVGPVLANIYITIYGFSSNIQGNHIDGGIASQPPTFGIYNNGATGVNIDGNLFYFLKRDCVVLNNCLFCRVSNNIFENNHWSQRATVRAAVDCFSTKINNAAGYGVGSGITMTVDALTEPLWYGDIVTFSGGGVFTLTANAALSATTITGNLETADVADNELGYKITSDIVIGSVSVGAKGNQIIGNQFYLQTPYEFEQEVYAIREVNRGTSVSGNQYHHNRISTTVTAGSEYRTPALSIASPNSKRRGNVGYGSDSYASGESVIPIGSTHVGGPGVEYTHGLGFTPSVRDLKVIFATELASAGVTDWWISSMTDTVFRITFDAASSATINCYWSIDTP